MKHTIKVPTTVREFGDVADQLDMELTELLELLDDALGANWWNEDHDDLIITTDLPWPARTDSFGPKTTPASVPPGFTPSDIVCDLYVGKRMEGARWTIVSEYVPHTAEFSLTFWTADDDPMTAAEANEYATAMLEMGAYITTAASASKAAGATEGK
ncbi:hypothetical protein [Paenarthrobacter sp. CAP02]|uniref:hypothetical protein n=1 Tax=Paenarthrobacter sp. CAP02 TaxID=3158144 RepID=UPI0032DBCD3A